MAIDVFFIILLILACIKGYRKGLVLAIFSLLAIIIGIAAALKLSAFAAHKLQAQISVSSAWLPVIAFILVFIGVIVLVRLGAKLIEKTMEMALLGWVNKLAGMLVYMLLYSIVFSVFIFYAEKIQWIKPSVIQSSQAYSFIQPLAPAVIDGFGAIIPFFKNMFTSLENFFEALPA